MHGHGWFAYIAATLLAEPEGLHILLGRKQRAGEWGVGQGRAGLVIDPAAKHGKTPRLPGRGDLTSVFAALYND